MSRDLTPRCRRRLVPLLADIQHWPTAGHSWALKPLNVAPALLVGAPATFGIVTVPRHPLRDEGVALACDGGGGSGVDPRGPLHDPGDHAPLVKRSGSHGIAVVRRGAPLPGGVLAAPIHHLHPRGLGAAGGSRLGARYPERSLEDAATGPGASWCSGSLGPCVAGCGCRTPSGCQEALARCRSSAQTSSITVNGPSLTNDTAMSVRKRPVSTVAPKERSSSTTAPTNGSATSGRAAAIHDGRRPRLVSP